MKGTIKKVVQFLRNHRVVKTLAKTGARLNDYILKCIDKIFAKVDSKIFFFAFYLEQQGTTEKARSSLLTVRKKIENTQIYSIFNRLWLLPQTQALKALVFVWYKKCVVLLEEFVPKTYPFLKEQAFEGYLIVRDTLADVYYEYESHLDLENRRMAISDYYKNRHNFKPWFLGIPKRIIAGIDKKLTDAILSILARIENIKRYFTKKYWIDLYISCVSWFKKGYKKYRAYTFYDWWLVFFKYKVTKTELPKSEEQLLNEKTMTKEAILKKYGKPVYKYHREVGLFFNLCNRIFDGLLVSGIFYVVCYKHLYLILEDLYFLNAGTIFDNINVPFSGNTLGYMYHWQIFLTDSTVFWMHPVGSKDADFESSATMSSIEGLWYTRVLRTRNDLLITWMTEFTRAVELKRKFKVGDSVSSLMENWVHKVGREYPTFYDRVSRLYFRNDYEIVKSWVIVDLIGLPENFFANLQVSLLTLDGSYLSKLWRRGTARLYIYHVLLWEDLSGFMYFVSSTPYFVYYTVSTPWIGKNASYIGFSLLEETYYRQFVEYLKSFRSSIVRWGHPILNNSLKLYLIADFGVLLEYFSGNKYVNWLTYIVATYFLAIILFANWYFYFGEYISCFVYLTTTTGLAYTSGAVIVVGTICAHNFFFIFNLFISFWDSFIPWVIAEQEEIRFWSGIVALTYACLITLHKMVSNSIFALYYTAYELFVSGVLLFFYSIKLPLILKARNLRDRDLSLEASKILRPKMLYARMRYVGRGARYFTPNLFKHYRYLPRLWYGLLTLGLFKFCGGYLICIHLFKGLAELFAGDIYMLERSYLSGVNQGSIQKGVKCGDLLIYKFEWEKWRIWYKLMPLEKIKYKHGVRNKKPRFLFPADFGDTRLDENEISVLRFRNKHLHSQILSVPLDPPYRKVLGGILEEEKLYNWVSDYYAGYLFWDLIPQYKKWPAETRRGRSVYLHYEHWKYDMVDGFAIPLLFGYTGMVLVAIFTGIPLHVNDKELRNEKDHKSYNNFYLFVITPFLYWFIMWFGRRRFDLFLDPSFGYIGGYMAQARYACWTKSVSLATHSYHLSEYQTVFLLLIE